MINFKQITIEGFGSIVHNTTFSLDREGLNIIRGKIGSGKTSVPSSLYWGIYGKSLKKGSSIETWPEYRGPNYKGTMVRIEFMKERTHYQIIRCISYKANVFKKQKGGSGLFIIKDGELEQTKGKIELQNIINSIIGYSSELFINSIIFGQRLKRIIEESGPNKKKIFDEAFETLFIDRAKDAATTSYKEINQLLSTHSLKKTSMLDRMSEAKQSYKDILKFEDNFEINKQSRLDKIDKGLKSNKQNIRELEVRVLEYKPRNSKRLRQEVIDIENEIETIENKIKRHTDIIKAIGEHEHTQYNLKRAKQELMQKRCFTCGNKIDSGTWEIMAKTNNDALSETKIALDKCRRMLKSSDIKELNKLFKKKHEHAKELENKLSKLESNIELKKILDSNLDNLYKDRKKLKKEYQEVSESSAGNKSGEYAAKIKVIRKDIEKIQAVIIDIEKKAELYNWLIKDPLSNSGIKAYIFNTLLDQVNNSLKSYSEILGFNIEFGIDMGTAAKDFYQVIYKDDIIIPYADLSGGQKQLVDTSVALAIHNVISSVRPVNILFLDEPFEGLDTETIDIVSEIISYKAIDRSLFIITHHLSFNPTNSNTIYFTLDKNQATKIN